MGMEDLVVLWVWGFCGDSHKFFCGYGMGMGIEIQSPRQPCPILYYGRSFPQNYPFPWGDLDPM